MAFPPPLPRLAMKRTIPSLRSETALSHSPALAHAPMAALNVMRSGATPSSRMPTSRRSACAHAPPFSHADTAAE